MSSYSDSDRVLDELLVIRILSGDAAAVDLLGIRWSKRMNKVALYLTNEPEMATEASQNTWLAICRNWSSLSDPHKFSAWAFGILRRKCADEWRKQQRYSGRNNPIPDASDIPVHAMIEANIAIQQAFSSLPQNLQITAHLFFKDGFTLSEISAVLNIPVGTVKSRIFTARQKLKNLL